MHAIQRMQLAVAVQRYRISSHANEEMSKDGLVSMDIESVIFTGKVVRRYTHDPRGTRYEVTGNTTDGRHACVVCRFLPSGVLLIITAYVK